MTIKLAKISNYAGGTVFKISMKIILVMTNYAKNHASQQLLSEAIEDSYSFLSAIKSSVIELRSKCSTGWQDTLSSSIITQTNLIERLQFDWIRLQFDWLCRGI